MDSKSLNITAEKIEQLRSLFPEVFSEEKVDFARLKEVLGENVAFPNEHYELSWAGKADARREIQKQTTATLVPDQEGSVNFGETENIFIEGENLEVLRILQKSYFGKIKMIFIDPPYNTGSDSFVYPDDYAERLDEYNQRTGKTDEQGYLNKQDLWRKNNRDNGQFHSVWLSMMYPRLFLSRNLLREDGLIFVSIDDNEASNLKHLMNEVFGEENFLADIAWEKRYTRSNDAKLFASVIDHIFVFRKSALTAYLREPRTEKSNSIYTNPDNDERGAWTSVSYVSQRTKEQRPNLSYKVKNPFTGEEIGHATNAWKYSPEQYQKHVEENRLFWGETGGHRYPRLKKFLSELGEGLVPINLWGYKDSGSIDEGTKEVDQLLGKDVFDYPKPTKLIKRMLQLSTNIDDEHIILDFFAGSGTTAQAVLELNEIEDGGNRKFICVQMPEVLEEKSEAYKAGYRTIADICKARIQKVTEKLQKARDKELPLESKQPLGFNAFKLAASNFKSWRGDVEGEELLQQLDVFRQSKKAGSAEENMLYELLLKSGLPLTTKVEKVEIGEQNAYLVEGGALLIFFESYNKQVKDLIREKSPRQVVCLDSCFKGKDEDLSNFKLELKEAGIELAVI